MKQLTSITSARLLIFEGIMGSGKSTATRKFGERLATAGYQVAAYTEAADPHPVGASEDLPDVFEPWAHVSALELAGRIREKWSCYVEGRRRDEVFTVMDGQLFHGDLTNLFMMEMPAADISTHLRELMHILNPLRPMVVYLRQADLQHAIRTVFEARGPDWEKYQLSWKLRSPYATGRQLAGLAGLTSMYKDYRDLTDSLFAALDCPKLTVETASGEWQTYYSQITEAMKRVDVLV